MLDHTSVVPIQEEAARKVDKTLDRREGNPKYFFPLITSLVSDGFEMMASRMTGERREGIGRRNPTDFHLSRKTDFTFQN